LKEGRLVQLHGLQHFFILTHAAALKQFIRQPQQSAYAQSFEQPRRKPLAAWGFA
jgi:hypothetical protein